VAQAANPSRPRLVHERFEISHQALPEFMRFTKQQGLIEVALNKTLAEEIEGFTHIPTGINPYSGEPSVSEQRITQVSRLSTLRVITDS
jgi:DNA-binding transcriptional regulator LsrR (DeoR family)